MNKFTFTNPLNGQKIEVEGPPELTEAQAQKIFKEQFDAGSLVGLKPGDSINSASQLAGGLLSAASQTTQALLPQAAGLLNQGTALATSSISGITDAIKNAVPSNPINVSDIAKEVSGLMPMQGLSQLDVRAAVSQAGKLVGQASDAISNELGVGKFGFDAQQLEQAGVLKPGTFSTYISAGAANLTSVLNSPAVWTGANGITDVDKLLSSMPTQNLIQQDLMSQGLAGAKELGVSLDKLGAAAQAGLALNASKSINDAVDWSKGVSLPAELQQSFDKIARDGAFAVDFAQDQLNDAMKQLAEDVPGVATVERETLDAAVTRVTGNAKIPPVNFTGAPDTTGYQIVEDFRDASVRVLSFLQREQPYAIKQANQYLTQGDLAGLVSISQRLDELLGEYLAAEGEYKSAERKAKALDAANGTTTALQNLEMSYPGILKEIQGRMQGIETMLARVRQEIASLTA